MNWIYKLSLFLTLALSLCAAEEKYEAGREYDAVLPGSGLHVKLYVPLNYTPDHKWPLIIFYHGLGGSPTTDCIARHCEGRDFIIVGMSYCERHTSPLSKPQHVAYIQKERKNLLTTVGWVKENISLDTQRVFMGGISKGGWTTSFVGEREMKRLAGLIILLAGRQRGAVPGSQTMTGFPIYVGVGEMDPNQLSSVHGVGFYRHCGADVTYEEFAGLGHQAPQKAQRLVQWLEAYGPQSHPWIDGAEKELRKAEYKRTYEKALENTDKTAVCRELHSLLDDPRLVVACGVNTRKAIAEKLNALAKNDTAAAKELLVERTFYNLVWREWKMRTIDETQVVIDGYSRLQRYAPDSRYAGYAEKSHARLLPVYQSAQSQLKQLKSQQKSIKKRASKPGIRNSSVSGSMSIF